MDLWAQSSVLSGFFCSTAAILLAWAESLWCNRKESQALWKFILKIGLKYYRGTKIQLFQQLSDLFRNLYCFFASNEGLSACWIPIGLAESSPHHCPSRAAIYAQMSKHTKILYERRRGPATKISNLQY